MKVLNRITVADIIRGAKALKFDKDGKPVLNEDGTQAVGGLDKNKSQDLYFVMGKARDVKRGTTQYGDYLEYFGVFEARRVCDGEVFTAGRVIFPEPTGSVVENIFLAAKGDDASAEVSFAFCIGTEEHSHAGETKFRYTCEPFQIGDMAKTDPLADLRAALEGTGATRFLGGAATPALAAPTEKPAGKSK